MLSCINVLFCLNRLFLKTSMFTELLPYTGPTLDILARLPLWKVGLDYRHGTGHGVGIFLNVHEGKLQLALLNSVYDCGCYVYLSFLCTQDPMALVTDHHLAMCLYKHQWQLPMVRIIFPIIDHAFCQTTFIKLNCEHIIIEDVASNPKLDCHLTVVWCRKRTSKEGPSLLARHYNKRLKQNINLIIVL